MISHLYIRARTHKNQIFSFAVEQRNIFRKYATHLKRKRGVCFAEKKNKNNKNFHFF